jgi:hypothetical protein
MSANAYIHEPYVTPLPPSAFEPMPGDFRPKIPSRFSTWDRKNLENLAEELVAELNETKEELRVALKGWRRMVKDTNK